MNLISGAISIATRYLFFQILQWKKQPKLTICTLRKSYLHILYWIFSRLVFLEGKQTCTKWTRFKMVLGIDAKINAFFCLLSGKKNVKWFSFSIYDFQYLHHPIMLNTDSFVGIFIKLLFVNHFLVLFSGFMVALFPTSHSGCLVFRFRESSEKKKNQSEFYPHLCHILDRFQWNEMQLKIHVHNFVQHNPISLCCSSLYLVVDWK